MPQRSPVEPGRRRRFRWMLLTIPGAAFAFGLVVAVGAAKSRGEPYRGVYRQEAVEVLAARSGKIVSLDASRGTPVKPGDRLGVIEDAAVASKIASLTASRDDTARELDVATRKAAAELTPRLASLEKDRLDTRLRYADLLRARLDVQVRRKALERSEELMMPVAGGAVSVRTVSVDSAPVDSPSVDRRLDLADARNHEEVLGTQIALCEERLGQLDRAIADLPEQLDRAHEVDRLRTRAAEISAELANASQADTSVEVVSPAHGRVGVYRRRTGEPIAAGDTLVQVFDAERAYVLLTVELDEAAKFVPGRKATVAFEGVESRKPLSGTVVDVTSEAELEADAATTPGTLSLRVRIAPAGRLWPAVPPGTTAVVTLQE